MQAKGTAVSRGMSGVFEEHEGPLGQDKGAGSVTRDVAGEVRGGWRGVRSHRLLEATVKTLAFILSEIEGPLQYSEKRST